ncbi:MAG: ABC transporter ATP-binding protein [Planctomycetaceae bacterium]|nr:ABC transporter ATP-binding protein [Planctomycetaceae bacterium]
MIELKNVSLQSGQFHLKNLSVRIEKGEYAVLIGKSGSGKTTLLEGLCGLRSLIDGEIWLCGQNASSWPPAQRGIGFVPQDAALFDSMTVREQIGFAMELKFRPPQEIADRTQYLAERMKITELLDRNPKGLSGGEQKRVALARALSAEPKILCFDEPLSALDEETSHDMIELLKSLKGEYTVLHITHNRYEVELLADRCLLLQDGILKRVDHLSTVS